MEPLVVASCASSSSSSSSDFELWYMSVSLGRPKRLFENTREAVHEEREQELHSTLAVIRDLELQIHDEQEAFSLPLRRDSGVSKGCVAPRTEHRVKWFSTRVTRTMPVKLPLPATSCLQFGQG